MARAADGLGATAVSAPVTITNNAPPVVLIEYPPDGAEFVAPATVPMVPVTAKALTVLLHLPGRKLDDSFISPAKHLPFTQLAACKQNP